MKVIFCWSQISGYMGACWRELANRQGTSLFVIAVASDGNSAFKNDLLRGIPHRLLTHEELADPCRVEAIVTEQDPDVVVISGWWAAAYRKLTTTPKLVDCKFIMAVDNSWRHVGQYLTRIRHWRYLSHIDHVFVPGERAWQYIRRLGFRGEQISRGLYGVDFARWSQVLPRRQQSASWPKRFLFIGRYVDAKAPDVLISAYQRYRTAVQDPWPLTCCGLGPQRELLRSATGVTDRGFIQPRDLDEVFLESGAFILPSRYDPWPLALVEAASAGLPVICSDACGSAVEVVRDGVNGLIFPSESAESLCNCMLAVHREDDLDDWGRAASQFASAYSTKHWTDQWIRACNLLATGT